MIRTSLAKAALTPVLASLLLWGAAAPRPAAAGPARGALPELDTGGYVLYQPINDAAGQVADGTYPPSPGEEDRVYEQTKVRWVAVGFLRVAAQTGEGGGRDEHWYLSLDETDSTVGTSPVQWVEKFYWPGRISPAADKHYFWNNLPIRFVRRNDLSGAADLAEFVTEVSGTYGFDLSAAADDFDRHDGSAALASGY